MSNWISVDERLPAYELEVLVWEKTKRWGYPAIAKLCQGEAKNYMDDYWYIRGETPLIEVTHWQSIDAPTCADKEKL